MKQESWSPRAKYSKRVSSALYVTSLLLAYLLGYLCSSTSRTTTTINKSCLTGSTHPVLNHVSTVTRVVNTRTDQSDDHNRFGPEQCGERVKDVRRTILDRVFKGTNPWQNFPPRHVENLLRKKWIKGWGSKGAVFENLIRRVQPKTVIEVGTFLGASALHMVELTRRLGLNTEIICIDDFRGWPGFSDGGRLKDMKMVNGDVMLMYQFMQNVVSANATESIVYMPFSSGSALEKLCEWGVYGDLIEVDAGHDFHSAWSDINRAFKLLKPGGDGVMFGHDYFTSADDRGVRRAVNLFARVHNLTVQVDGQHWVIHINKSLSYS